MGGSRTGGTSGAGRTAVTIADVARRAGTSTAVVSYALNDGPRPVAAATRDRVLTAAAELGYRPNRNARALRSGTSGLVGLVLPDAANPYFGALGRRLEDAIGTVDKLALVANAGFDSPRERDAIERLLAAGVDGLIVVPSDGGDDTAAVAGKAGTPAVYVHNGPADSAVPRVTVDNHAAIIEAVEHLRAHGHDRIDFLTGLRDNGPIGERLEGWRAATGGAGRLLRCPLDRSASAALIDAQVADGTLATAMVVATDEHAIGVLAAAHARAVAIPTELAVISCDGSPEAAFTAPTLTAVEQPLAEMARTAVERLFADERRSISLRPRLSVRRSCGCPPPAFR